MEERGSGWIAFAGIMLIIGGIMRFFDAIWAFSYHGVLPTNLEGAIFGHSLKTYGWVYLTVAIVLVLCGFAVFAQSQAARWIGVFAGAVACIERDLVDAVLPDLGVHLHRDRRTGRLRPRRLRRQGRKRRVVTPRRPVPSGATGFHRAGRPSTG